MQNWKLQYCHSPYLSHIHTHTNSYTSSAHPFDNAAETGIASGNRVRKREQIPQNIGSIECNKLKSRLNKRKANKSIRKRAKVLITHKDVRTRNKRNHMTCKKK